MFDGTNEERGNLCDLKKRGLVTTDNDEDIIWVQFTDEGKALAKANGYNID